MKYITIAFILSILSIVSIYSLQSSSKYDDKQVLINNAFFTEAQKGNLEEVKRYIKEKLINKEYIREDNVSQLLLKYAAISRNEKLVGYILKQGVEININNDQTYSALHYVCCENDLDAAKILIKKGANVNSISRVSEVLSPIACAVGNLDLVKYLICKGAIYGIIDENYKSSAIRQAAYKGKVDTFLYLAKMMPDDWDWQLMLSSAIVGNNLEIIKYLVEEKATDINYTRGALSKCTTGIII